MSFLSIECSCVGAIHWTKKGNRGNYSLRRMNIAYTTEQISMHNIFLTENKKNIMMDGTFTKLVYSDECISLNGLSLHVPFVGALCERKHNKTMLRFSTDINHTLIRQLIHLEQYILDMYRHTTNNDKMIVLTLQDHLLNGSVKIYRDREVIQPIYIVKISGIWEDTGRIGLTYKFLEAGSAKTI